MDFFISNVDQLKGPMNQFKPVQQSRQQGIRAYCPNIYTVQTGDCQCYYCGEMVAYKVIQDHMKSAHGRFHRKM